MSSLALEDSYWDAVDEIDTWLDEGVGSLYREQPLAQDWARVSKVAEELGECIAELILHTGQNPRKPQDNEAFGKMLAEMADVVCTGTLAIQHFTKDTRMTRNMIQSRMNRIWVRMKEIVNQ